VDFYQLIINDQNQIGSSALGLEVRNCPFCVSQQSSQAFLLETGLHISPTLFLFICAIVFAAHRSELLRISFDCH
jgi:hypothetical protein